MGKQHEDIAIVGAGIVGIACAIYLQREGHRVTVIDKGAPGRGTSFGNAGSIAPGSLVPMALPGTLKNVPRWITDPLGPLTLSWRQVPALLPWLLHFRRACTPDRAAAGARALRALNGPSLDSYRDLLASAGAPDLLRHAGMLHLYRSQAAFDASAYARRLRTDNQAEVELIDAARIRAIEPAVSPEYRWGFFLPDNGHVGNPLRVVEVLARHFADNGGTIVEARATDLDADARSGVRLRTSAGNVEASRMVIAAGVWSQQLARRAGARVPIAPERGYHIEIEKPGVALRCPVTDGELRFVATPMEGGLRLAGTSEFRRADAPANWARTEALTRLGPRMLPGLKVEAYTRWMGTRPSTPDSLPAIGPVPGCERVLLAYGHGHFGLMAAPMTGQLIADLVAGRTPRIDVTPFRPDRFARQRR